MWTNPDASVQLFDAARRLGIEFAKCGFCLISKSLCFTSRVLQRANHLHLPYRNHWKSLESFKNWEHQNFVSMLWTPSFRQPSWPNWKSVLHVSVVHHRLLKPKQLWEICYETVPTEASGSNWFLHIFPSAASVSPHALLFSFFSLFYTHQVQ